VVSVSEGAAPRLPANSSRHPRPVDSLVPGGRSEALRGDDMGKLLTPLVANLRREVKDWRDRKHAGASWPVSLR
jgi:hypothetical protein